MIAFPSSHSPYSTLQLHGTGSELPEDRDYAYFNLHFIWYVVIIIKNNKMLIFIKYLFVDPCFKYFICIIESSFNYICWANKYINL